MIYLIALRLTRILDVENGLPFYNGIGWVTELPKSTFMLDVSRSCNLIIKIFWMSRF
jgi:hypothetical protein